MTSSQRKAFPAFAGRVIAAGVLALGTVGEGWHQVRLHPLVAVALAILLLVAELKPVALLHRRAVVEVATSTTFTLALLLFAGIGPALVAQLVASVASDLLRRKGLMKTTFNAAQFAIAIVAAGSLLIGLAGRSILNDGLLEPAKIPAVVAAAVVFFVINHFLVWTVIALATGDSFRQRIADEWVFLTASSLVLLGLAPVVDLIAVKALPMLPLLLIPVGAVYLTAKSSITQAQVREVSERIEAQAERERLEAHIDRARLEAQLRQSQRLESLGQLAGGIAHDFNNLLGAIINYALFVGEAVSSAVETDPSRDWTSVRSDVAEIERAADRAAQLTHQLLAFARGEIVRPQVLVVNEIVTEVEQLLRRTIGEHVVLATHLKPGLWPVLADRGQIEQVLVNLALNARDAMTGGGTLTIETDTQIVDEAFAATTAGLHIGPHVRLRVSDTGAGMAPEVVDRAFEPFFTTKPRGEGSGLGLATVYGIITQWGGRVQIDSEPGFGTSFSVLLPATEQAAPAADQPLGASITGGGETILVVEDEEGLRHVTNRILVRNGYQVLGASNGAAAVELVKQHDGPIDLVLSDVVMPQMVGDEVAQRVSALRPGIRVLYMSGYAQPMLGGQGTLIAGVELVEKPFSEKTLLTKVREVLDGPSFAL